MESYKLYGFSYEGPFDYFFRKWMEIIFKGKKDKKTVAKKVLLEQLTAAPWINFCFMMYRGLVVEGSCFPNGTLSVGKMYFHYYGQLLHQQNILQDYVRTGTYYAAIIENRADFVGHVVVDVGAGSGILSLFAAQNKRDTISMLVHHGE